MERTVERDDKGNDTVRSVPSDEREAFCRIHLIADQQLDFIRIRDLLTEISPKRYHLTLSLDYEGGFREIAQGGYDLCLVRERIGAARAIPWLRQAAEAFETPLVLLATSSLSRISEAIEAGVEEVLDFNRLGPQQLARTIEVTIARQRRRIRLARREECYRIAAERAGEGYWRWNPIQRCIELPPSARRNLGLGRENDVTPAVGWASIHPEDVERAQYEITEHAAGRKPQVAVEFRIRNAAGAWRWVLCRGKGQPNPQGELTEICGLIDDITERKALVEQARHEAFHDPLTGLPNRALFTERLAQALKRRRREPHFRFAVLFLDLDRFKIINDSLGHLVGDQLLIAVSRKLEMILRSVDTVARLGGDEFTVLLCDIHDVRDAVRVAERIQEEISIPIRIGGQEIYTTASIGIAMSTLDYTESEELMRAADTAMYRAKEAGKARYEIFDVEMHQAAMQRLQLETDLRFAVERKEFRIHYQPVVELASSRIVGFEALLRWHHPTRGLLAPHSFISVAEEIGITVEIGVWVFEEACRQLRHWNEIHALSPKLWVSVNLTERQFAHPDFLDMVFETLTRTRLDPSLLRLELTESVMQANARGIWESLARMKAMGLQVQIDDFGTGFSSLHFLRQMPIDKIKIDRTFIEKIGTEAQDLEIIRATVVLAHNLGIDIVAEGVETEAQRALLLELSCLYGQGYLFDRPLTPGEVSRKLSERCGNGEVFAMEDRAVKFMLPRIRVVDFREEER